jgi:hypothetical protein
MEAGLHRSVVAIVAYVDLEIYCLHRGGMASDDKIIWLHLLRLQMSNMSKLSMMYKMMSSI